MVTPYVSTHPSIAGQLRLPPHGGKTRKCKANCYNWKQSKRKRLRQSGKEYINIRGKVIQPKSIKNKKDCGNCCKFKCSVKISEDERKILFNGLWVMSQIEKQHFFSKTTERIDKKTTQTNKVSKSRRKYFYNFFVDNVKHRVCKVFYLSTLDISSRQISYYHENKLETGIPAPTKWGKHCKKKVLEMTKQSIENHINLFPRVESHYCRSISCKQYFDGSLNLKKLYDLYLTYCTRYKILPAKECMYCSIFNTKFNIEFHKSIKDLCDTCYQFCIIENANEEQIQKYNKHIASKNETKIERDKDRKLNSPTTTIVCIDLQNVLSLPKSNVGNFFYKRKLSYYNLTGYSSLNKKAYCVLWHEGMSGHSGNDIASAVICMLNQVYKDLPNIDKFLLWFDSCVPQNRNSQMSAALREFLIDHPNIEIIEQKYCKPGHSSIQECDNIHCQIEKSLHSAEIFSPPELVKAMLNVNQCKPFFVYQMQKKDIKNFSKTACLMNYKKVPYFNVITLVYRSNAPGHGYFKNRFTDIYKEARLSKPKNTRASGSNLEEPSIPLASCFRHNIEISSEKV